MAPLHVSASKRQGSLEDILGCSKASFLFACAWYCVLWGPALNSRIKRLASHVRLSVCARLEDEEEDVKRAYGQLVRQEDALYVGYSRLFRRYRGRGIPAWPGTNNMRGGPRKWLQENGLLAAVEAVAPTKDLLRYSCP